MQILDGYKTGGDVMLLPEGRRISKDNLWGLRVLMLFLAFGAVSSVNQTETTVQNGQLVMEKTGGPIMTLGAILGVVVVYWLALRMFSAVTEDVA